MSVHLPIEAPTGWRYRRIQALFRMHGGGTPAKEKVEYWDGNIPWVSPKDMKTDVVSSTEDTITEQAVHASATRIVPEGCLLVVVRSGILKHSIPTALAGTAVALNQDMKALVPVGSVDSRFMRYMIDGHEQLLLTIWRSLGATVESLDSERIKQSVVPFPPLPTQKAIADYLDEKTAAIDALIEKKRKLLDLLAEERAALINQAVTKGLDPTVPMKDSGIPWIGEVPAHWRVVRLRRIGKVDQGCSFPHAIQGTPFGEFPWYKVNDMNRHGNEEVMHEADSYVDREIAQKSRATIFPVGTVVFPRVGAALLTNKRRILSCPSIVDDNVYGFVPGAIKSYFAYYVLSLIDLASLSSAGLVPTVTIPIVKDIAVPFPPLGEQETIAVHIQGTLARTDVIASKTQLSLDRLQEYRQALITAAVTGQLDIGTAA